MAHKKKLKGRKIEEVQESIGALVDTDVTTPEPVEGSPVIIEAEIIAEESPSITIIEEPVTTEAAPQALAPVVEKRDPKDRLTLKDKSNMFKDWVMGMGFVKLGKKYRVSRHTVQKISMAYKWKELKVKASEKMFASAVQGIKMMSQTIVIALKRDMELIIGESIRKKCALTKDERDHFRHLLDRFLKESRLDEGKPTDISNGVKQVELILPPGVSSWGVLPPDPRVIFIESGSDDKVKDDIEIDDLDLTGE